MGATFLCEGGCGREIEERPRRKTRLCRYCCGRLHGSDPELSKKTAATIKRKLQDPDYKAAHVERTTAGMRIKLATDPAEAQRRREAGRRLYETGKGHAAQPPGSDARMRVGRQNTERRIGWCPRHLRDQYRQLTKSKGYTAAEARKVIEEQIERERMLRNRPLSFAEQLDRVRSGEAKVVEKFKPTAGAGPFTLGGVASGFL